jgi:hypothetical protein
MSRRRFVHTLSGRLILLFVGMAVLFVLVVGAGMGRAFRGHFESTVRPHLYRYLAYVRNDIGNPPSLERASCRSPFRSKARTASGRRTGVR